MDIPLVISLNADGLAYKKGFKKPRGLFPSLMSASLMVEMTLAKIGLEQLVPSTPSNWPSTTISRLVPIAATSGKARPETLNLPLLVEPIEERNELTADAWYDGVAKKLEKPPDENDAAVSLLVPESWVAPTEVMLCS